MERMKGQNETGRFKGVFGYGFYWRIGVDKAAHLPGPFCSPVLPWLLTITRNRTHA